MKVYRLCKRDEVDLILDKKQLNGLGKVCLNDPKLNNHIYDCNKKYMHFFEDKGSLFYLCVTTGTYICTYDIPDDLIGKYKGEGYYLDREFLRVLQSVSEYAIPSDELSFEYLNRIERVKSYVDYEDYLYDGDILEVETIYDSEKKNKQKVSDRK